MAQRQRNELRALLKLDEAAKAVGVSTRTLRREIDDGDLIPTRIRGQLRIHPDDLDDYIRQCGEDG